jgi:hypothetical protein
MGAVSLGERRDVVTRPPLILGPDVARISAVVEMCHGKTVRRSSIWLHFSGSVARRRRGLWHTSGGRVWHTGSD